MKPMEFKEQTGDLTKPPGMTDDECGSLPVWCDGTRCISKWKMTWKERLSCLFRGYVWVHVVSGHTQPPIVIMAYKTAFEPIKKEK